MKGCQNTSEIAAFTNFDNIYKRNRIYSQEEGSDLSTIACKTRGREGEREGGESEGE